MEDNECEECGKAIPTYESLCADCRREIEALEAEARYPDEEFSQDDWNGMESGYRSRGSDYQDRMRERSQMGLCSF